ncbi:MAG TPA: 1-deoxy-D-xylulose-5-phosphate reductoisomerase [Gammaproteobacteria bacterium]|nr:1-deoxy-D-xylulose-5-phosphate reductoisomerase [Gammaproteobacteria bacterium]
MIGVTILGATGSIGISTLEVMKRHGARFRPVALTANSQVERLFQLCIEHRPEYAVMGEEDAAQRLRERLRSVAVDIEVLSGTEGLKRVATLEQTDCVMAAIVGAAGLEPTLAAARAGKRILLANKEALVMSGRIFMDAVRQGGAELLPVDSEHNAIFQCMPDGFSGLAGSGVTGILLTASGGPFRDTPLERFADITPEQACAHPNWEMGRKISVDSATMMNKGLEVIEACWLFDAAPEQIRVVLHPQSVIHSLVQYSDGSVLAQLGNPDMRTPIAHALAWPARIDSGVAPLDLVEVARLDFGEPDLARFPCLRLAYQAAGAGGTCPAILNAANEVAVAAFLERRLRFDAIAPLVEETMQRVSSRPADSLEAVLQDDTRAREVAMQLIGRHDGLR